MKRVFVFALTVTLLLALGMGALALEDIYECRKCSAREWTFYAYARRSSDADTAHYRAYICKGCAYIVTDPDSREAHAFTSPATCERASSACACGYIARAPGHDFSGAYVYAGADAHWIPCGRAGCEAKAHESAHVLSAPANCEAASPECVCGYARPALGHIAAGEWLWDAQAHYKLCAREGCAAFVNRVAHSYATPPSCEAESSECLCGYVSPALGHDYGAWQKSGESAHARVCSRDGAHNQTLPCAGGEATCKSPARCATCSGLYGEIDPYNHEAYTWVSAGYGYHTLGCDACGLREGDVLPCEGAVMSCTNRPLCEYCGRYFGMFAHVWGEWTPVGNGTHVRACLRDSSHRSYARCAGGVSTCARGAVCEFCGDEYNEKLEHVYNEGAYTPPDCVSIGFTLSECTRRGCSQKLITPETPALYHMYAGWTPTGGGAHTAACVRDGCNYICSASCARVATESGGILISVCPICGEAEDGGVYEQIYDTRAQTDYGALACELVVRSGSLSDGTRLLLAALTFEGKPVAFDGVARVYIPAHMFEGARLYALNARGGGTEIVSAETEYERVMELDFSVLAGDAGLVIRVEGADGGA